MEAKDYGDPVKRHFRSPENAGDLVGADAVATVTNPVCGDTLKLAIRVREGRIDDVRFKTFGCTGSIAASSVATVLIKGKSIDEALRVTREEISRALGGLPETRIHCSVLAEDGIRAAIAEYRRTHGSA